jgi:myosin heavy subunit
MTIATSPRNLIGLSALLLMAAAFLSVLNTHKARSLRSNVTAAIAARDAAEHRRLNQEKELKDREANVATAGAKFTETESKAAKAEADFVKFQAEKVDLQSKLQAKETQIAELERRIEEATTKSSVNPGAPSTTELQAQLDDARSQLDLAEREKAVLSDKARAAQERSVQLDEDKKRRAAVSGKAGVRGTILAVNQAYNFVVLNLGGRHGVEPNSEMLVVRSGTLIGKIRVSSVEPATAIGDIITSSLARGVQVQPGDIVIYAGTS